MSKILEFTNNYLSKLFGVRLIETIEFDQLLNILTDLDRQLKGRIVCEYLPNTDTVRERFKLITDLLKPQAVSNSTKVRVGNTSDGGYICLDNFDHVKSAVSLGIKDDVTWDIDIARRGIDVFQYDYTIDHLPDTHPNFHFNKLKVSSVNGDGEISLNSILRMNALIEPKSVILKMDIEGSEWDTLSTASDDTLNTFTQIVCEFHDFNLIKNDEFYEKAISVLKKLKSKFEVFHIHGNNCAPLLICSGIGTIPQVMEISFAHKEIFAFHDIIEEFPTKLDSPSSESIPDYRIDFLSK